MLKSLSKLLHLHWALTLLIMCIAVISFGLLSYDFFSMFRTDLILIEQNGSMVMAEDGYHHLLVLLLYGFLGLLSYLVFKACEKILVERLTK
jgi:hypothetical protein